MPGLNPGLVCKANAVPSVLLLWPWNNCLFFGGPHPTVLRTSSWLDTRGSLTLGSVGIEPASPGAKQVLPHPSHPTPSGLHFSSLHCRFEDFSLLNTSSNKRAERENVLCKTKSSSHPRGGASRWLPAGPAANTNRCFGSWWGRGRGFKDQIVGPLRCPPNIGSISTFLISYPWLHLTSLNYPQTLT